MKATVMPKWFVYIVRCSDKSLYTGITTDVAARIKIHNFGKGAKYTRSRLPVKLVYKEAMRSESAARKREAEIKKLPRLEKLSLLRSR
jgi:putative endonuclease